MDRRSFFRSIILIPSLTPTLLAEASQRSGFELYIISDSPQRVISPILRELRDFGLIQGRRYNFSNPHPHQERLINALSQKGWRYVSLQSRADLTLSFSYLRERTLPSFTFIKNRRIWDIRSQELLSLWKEMNKNEKPSSCLTIISFKNKQPHRVPGILADILIDGRRVKSISLRKDCSERFRTQNGYIAVRVKDGKAWVTDSSCRRKICVYSSPASIAGERVICAPNHFLLEIKGTHSVDTSIG
jgi:hypothetical protein